MSDLLRHYERCFDAARGRDGEAPPWLASLRSEAAGRFLEVGFPTAKHEEWRYTNPAALTKTPFTPATPAAANVAASGADVEALRDTLGMSACRIFLDGRPALDGSTTLPEGIEVHGLAHLAREDAQRLEGRLGALADAKEDALAALNAALFEDGAAVFVGRNARVAEPVHLLFAASRMEGSSLSTPRLLIVAEAGSETTIWIDHATLGSEAGLTNAVTEVFCGEGAIVRLVTVQRESGESLYVGNVFVSQERDSQLSAHTVTLSGELVRNDVHVRMVGEGADCTLNGLFLGANRQRVDNHTLIDHAVPHCTSHELYKGVLGGKSRGVFRGRVVVRPDAQKTAAEQSNANLIVSAGAEVDTKPQLEIYADDVRCSHGSTVGQLDPDAVFYLRTRGIGEEDARDLLTRGFAQEIVEALPEGPGRDAIDVLLEQALREVVGGGPR